MARYAYDRLTAADSSFLLIEQPNVYMHIASTGIFDPGPLVAEGGGIDFETIRDSIDRLLHLVPRYRQKLAWVPLTGNPVWVDDAGFNINYHVRHTRLPSPGTERQLKRLAARITSQHLDRSKPLWEAWIVEGLEDGRLAIITKVHQCMVDGVAGVDLLTVMMSTTPDYEISEPPAFMPRGVPSGGELLRHEVLRELTGPIEALRRLGDFAREAADRGEDLATRARALVGTLDWLRPPAETPFNAPLCAHRRFDWTSIDLADVKTVRKALGGTVNDVLLATTAGAVRAFLERRRVDPAQIPFRVLAPVSVRAPSEQGDLGNRIAGWIIDLPIGEPAPRQRLAEIAKQTSELKESRPVVAADILTRIADWAPTRFVSFGARAVSGRLPFNMLVTNVPGPQLPLYLLGAKLVESYPCVPLPEGVGLGIALFSYDGRVYWGLNADWELIPDLHDLLQYVELAFGELLAEATPVRVAGPAAAASAG